MTCHSFDSSAFATNKDIRCHFGSSTTSKSDISSYRFSEGSSVFRKSVLHRIRFGNTVRFKDESANSNASSLRTNDLLSSERRSSRSLAAYPDQWMPQHRRRSSNVIPQAPAVMTSTDNPTFRASLSSQKTSELPPAVVTTDQPMVALTAKSSSSSTSAGTIEPDTYGNPAALASQLHAVAHFPDCIFSGRQSSSIHSITSNDLIRQRRKSKRKKSQSSSQNDLSLSMRLADIESESSSIWTNDGLRSDSLATALPRPNSEPVCTCQLLWQLERDTDSIDKFKLFFKRDHLNVDWDYVQGSSEV